MTYNADGLAHMRAGPMHNPIPADVDFNYLDAECSIPICMEQAIEQDHFEVDLCHDHLKYEI